MASCTQVPFLSVFFVFTCFWSIYPHHACVCVCLHLSVQFVTPRVFSFCVAWSRGPLASRPAVFRHRRHCLRNFQPHTTPPFSNLRVLTGHTRQEDTQEAIYRRPQTVEVPEHQQIKVKNPRCVMSLHPYHTTLLLKSRSPSTLFNHLLHAPPGLQTPSWLSRTTAFSGYLRAYPSRINSKLGGGQEWRLVDGGHEGRRTDAARRRPPSTNTTASKTPSLLHLVMASHFQLHEPVPIAF